jgi:SAM-dependent methyltransferase
MLNFITVYNFIVFILLLLIIYISYTRINKKLGIFLFICMIYMYYTNIQHVKNRNFINKIQKQIHNISEKEQKSINDLKILDFGSGANCIIAKKFPNLNIKSIDIMPSNEKNYIQYDGNVKNLPFEDNSFDIVICCFVIHHIKDQDSVINELKRISKYAIIYEDDIYGAPNNYIAKNIVSSHYLFFGQKPECIEYMHTPDEWITLFNSKLIYKENINGILTYGFVPHICLIFDLNNDNS